MQRIENIKSTDVKAMLESQQYTCPLSGRPLTPESASLDHIIPLAQDGDHAIENIWIVDHQINAAKGTMTADEFIQMCHEVTHYQKQQHDDDQFPLLAVPSPQ